jgi:hypothetical protein
MTPAEVASLAGLTPANEKPGLSFWPVAELGQGHRRSCWHYRSLQTTKGRSKAAINGTIAPLMLRLSVPAPLADGQLSACRSAACMSCRSMLTARLVPGRLQAARRVRCEQATVPSPSIPNGRPERCPTGRRDRSNWCHRSCNSPQKWALKIP